MPNILDQNGLQTQTRSELVAQLEAAYRSIYGNDITLTSDTPDGQIIGIYVQAYQDLLDLIAQTYTSFDPDQAIGVILDQRCAINGVQRQAGTYSTTNVELVLSSSATLYGLDQSGNEVYTVKDNAGNKWQLINTVSPSVAGTYTYEFRAQLPGKKLTIPNTITTASTIVLGVVSINNPSAQLVIGLDEETDAVLKIRRQQSVALPSQGYYESLKAALKNINGIVDAFIYENNTADTDANGVPSHSIWVIISGTASADYIANTIYKSRNAGCGMFGAISYILTRPDGSPFIIRWDNVQQVDLYIKFTVTSIDGINQPNISGIKTGLLTGFAPAVAQEININALATAIQKIDPNALVTDAGFSLSATGPFTPTLSPASKAYQFEVAEDRIIVLPIQIDPSSYSIVTGGTKQFTAVGGYGVYAWSFDTNVSGGAINPTTGVYVAGITPGTDVIKVTDDQLNTQTASIVVHT